jgi:NAD(P)-dependent dehydrogenase (short-subunit alcohol dehydrogenase family)
VTGKVALVTGAGSGIGRVSAIALAGAGFRVVLAGRRPAPLEAVAAEIGGTGGEAIAVQADVGDPGSVATLFAAVGKAFGRLDLLFNNAGLNPPAAPIEDLAFETWQATIAANVTGVFLCTREAFRMMKAQDPMGGRIINNGSIAAYAPRPLTLAYTASKHAVTGITRQTALDGRPYNIACGQIDIGNARTAMTADRDSGVLQADGALRVEPRLDLDHVARSVVHMASLPLEANVLFMTVMATAMPYVGRG